jgi:hypothetical protein
MSPWEPARALMLKYLLNLLASLSLSDRYRLWTK